MLNVNTVMRLVCLIAKARSTILNKEFYVFNHLSTFREMKSESIETFITLLPLTKFTIDVVLKL